MGDYMSYEEEMVYRENILSKIRNGAKITPEERLWLVTHRIINRRLKYPYLNTDIIHLNAKEDYLIRVKVEDKTYSDRIIPFITVPGGKGRIVATNVVDRAGKLSSKKQIKMIGLLVDLNRNLAEISYCSELGLLGISYECDYFDDKQNIMIRKDSCIGDPNFAMTSEFLSHNKVLYRCKSPISDDFQSLVFSVEWNTVDKNR